MATELAAVAEAADADDAVRVVVVTGSGRAFCAGADLGGGPDTFADRGDRVRPPGPLSQEIGGFPRDAGGVASLPFAALRKPVIAAVNGPAVGIGATLTLPMDIRIAAESARFGFVFARVGIVPEAASSWFLPRVVGISQAMEWVATGRVLAFFAQPRPAPKVFPELTDREREILGLIAQGHPNPSIARTLFLSPKTVANYVSAIFAKLQVADRAEAMIRAREAGLGS